MDIYFSIGGITVAFRPGWQSFQAACTYIGSVVGAGFASGQEIHQFFGQYGNYGYLATAIAIFLFAFLGWHIMRLGQEHSAQSFKDVTAMLVGKRLGKWMDTLLIVMLFAVTVAMLAGAGELFHEQFGWPIAVGALFTIFVTIATLVYGMDGVLRANSIIVPIMISFIVVTALYTARHIGFTQAWINSSAATPSWFFESGMMAVLYAAFNTGLSAGVLLPLGATIRNQRTLRLGAILGAAGLGVMMTAVEFSLFANGPQVMQFAIPMAHIAISMGAVLRFVFVLVLWAEIYSTLVGDVYALSKQLSHGHPNRFLYTSIIVLVAAFIGSQIGFSTIVKYGYSAVAWASLFLLLVLFSQRYHLPQS